MGAAVELLTTTEPVLAVENVTAHHEPDPGSTCTLDAVLSIAVLLPLIWAMMAELVSVRT